MASAKAALGSVLGRFIFREATVSLAEPLGARFRRLVLSGRAAAIQAVRKGLKARGVPLSEAKTKAYWAPGKVGLD